MAITIFRGMILIVSWNTYIYNYHDSVFYQVLNVMTLNIKLLKVPPFEKKTVNKFSICPMILCIFKKAIYGRKLETERGT